MTDERTRLILGHPEHIAETLALMLATLRAFDEALGTKGLIDARGCRELLRGMRALAARHVSLPSGDPRVAGTDISRESVRFLLLDKLPVRLGRMLTALRSSDEPPDDAMRADVLRHLIGIHVTASDLLASPTFRRRDTLPGVGSSSTDAPALPVAPDVPAA